ncbi:NucA/NucB deoxyribonuclease domain-containing protein [Streptomyces nigrescens]|uniref:Deoxyribonuclease NucA/NucB domain-containing protein n=1 Tax=Streptomyces nigrescens TaxID=1920 RepID=A0ABY7IZJ0_STRNI|nr:hypothetical protein [Streptomyces nigrescens]WAU03723.1 hypothetical protein STRNI_001887 [Streptomyces nigrescens]
MPRVETYVLPVGTPTPTLEELESGEGLRTLEQAAAKAGGARNALETVGPAAGYAAKSVKPSLVGPALSTAAGSAAATGSAALEYPDPPRSMSLAECKAHMGGDAKYYLKSRFSVCTALQITQVWTSTRGRVGASNLTFYVRGSVPKDTSRTINFDWDVTDFTKIGNPPTSGLMYTVKANLPQTWPANAKVHYGGTTPNAKSYDQLARMRPAHFTHTVTVNPGQGNSGRTDLVAAIYEPTISGKLPPGWLGDGKSGKPFMLAPRWDAAPYLKNSTGGGTPTKRGAASFAYLGFLHYSTKATAPERGVAQHIKTAYTQPSRTKPTNPGKRVAGQDPDHPLHRLFADTVRRDRNRTLSIADCKRYFGPKYSENNTKDCDEFPFASTYEGAAEFEYTGDVMKNNYSVLPVNKKQNGDAGTLLKSFYAKNRIIDGLEDGFLVQIH